MTTKSDELKQSVANIDGWENIYTREGVKGVAKSSGFLFKKDLRIDEQTARAIYRSDGFGSKIIDRPVGDMTRAWFDVVGDTDGVINKYLRTLKTKKNIKAALTWSKVFGGSIIVMGIDDGGLLEDELNEDNIKSIEFLQVYDRYRAQWTTADLYGDPEEPKFGLPKWYRVTPIASPSVPFRVHESRILRFDGPLTDDESFKQNNHWNESIYRKTLTQLINVNSSYAAAKDILDEFITTIIKIEGLQGMIAAGQDDLVKERLNILDLGKHIMNTLMLDGNEDYTKEASSVQGLPKLLQEFQQALAATADIPMTVLMGRSPGGMNATGDSDLQIYYDKIQDQQDDELFDPLMRLMFLAMKAKGGPTKGQVNEDWFIDFNSLWQPTEKDVVETRNKQADSDTKYISQGVLTPAEVAESRFGGDEYSLETVIDTELDRSPPAEPSKEIDPVKKDRQDKVFDNPDIIEGVTSEENDHTHEYFIFNIETGMGWTTNSGIDNHSHRIEGGTVQPFESEKTGTVHGHGLSKVK